jgi:hypothetical protein
MAARTTLFALVAVLAACTACAPLDRANECRTLARVTNPVLSDVVRDRTVVTGASYRIIAAKYDGLATSIGQVKIRTKHLAEAVNDYQRMINEAARDARAYADALDAKDEARILIVHAAASRTTRHEATALSRLDLACRIGR